MKRSAIIQKLKEFANVIEQERNRNAEIIGLVRTLEYNTTDPDLKWLLGSHIDKYDNFKIRSIKEREARMFQTHEEWWSIERTALRPNNKQPIDTPLKD